MAVESRPIHNLIQSSWRFSLAGIDGCKQGWVVAAVGKDECRVFLASSFGQVMSLAAPGAVVAVDIPIGLPHTEKRACDVEARKILGPKKQASVFYAPPACVLEAASHQEAADAAELATGKRISIQAWNLVPKIREVAEWMADNPVKEQGTMSQLHVFETHPELCFLQMNNGEAVVEPKKTDTGQDLRRRLLRDDAKAYGGSRERISEQIRSALRLKQGTTIAAVDDILDAFAALSAARRSCEKVATQLPASTSSQAGSITF